MICEPDENGMCRKCGILLGKNARLCRAEQPPMKVVPETPFVFSPSVKVIDCEKCSESREGTWCQPVYPLLRDLSVLHGGCCGNDGIPQPGDIESYIRNVEVGLQKCPKEDA